MPKGYTLDKHEGKVRETQFKQRKSKAHTRGVHYIHFGYGDVPLGRVSIFKILV